MTTTAEMLDRLIDTAPTVIAQWTKPGTRCIFATRLGLEVLRACRIEAEPYATEAVVYNAAGWRWELANRQGDPAALGVRTIVVGPESQGPGWSGHLVIRVQAADLPDGWALVDLDLQQFRRPAVERGGHTFGEIELPPAAWFPLTAPEGPWAWTVGEAGQDPPLVAYRPLPGPQAADWQDARDWKRTWEQELRRDIGALVRIVRA